MTISRVNLLFFLSHRYLWLAQEGDLTAIVNAAFILHHHGTSQGEQARAARLWDHAATCHSHAPSRLALGDYLYRKNSASTTKNYAKSASLKKNNGEESEPVVLPPAAFEYYRASVDAQPSAALKASLLRQANNPVAALDAPGFDPRSISAQFTQPRPPPSPSQCPQAALNLAWMYHYGLGGLPKDPWMAMSWYWAAKQSLPPSTQILINACLAWLEWSPWLYRYSVRGIILAVFVSGYYLASLLIGRLRQYLEQQPRQQNVHQIAAKDDSKEGQGINVPEGQAVEYDDGDEKAPLLPASQSSLTELEPKDNNDDDEQ